MTPAEKRKNAHLLRTYGITLVQWREILEYQGGVCPICGKGEKDGVQFTTDHSHKDPQIVRGIPCRYCNHRQIGRHTDPERLRRIADYLENPPAQAILGKNHVVPKKKRQPRKRPRKK